MDGNEIRHRSHGDIMLEREESSRERAMATSRRKKKQEAKQTGVPDLKA